MKRFYNSAVAFVIAVTLSVAAAAEAPATATMVPIKVVVMRKDKAQDGPKPFADVGGITIRRSNKELKNATCPNASNAKGELVCRVMCAKDDPDLSLQVFAPLKNDAPIVAGMVAPLSATVDIEKCVVTLPVVAKSEPTVRLVYRSAFAAMEELQTKAPAVIAAVATTKGSMLEFKPFAESAPALQKLAKEPANRDKLQQLAELAEVYKEGVEAGTGSPRPNLEDYASGASSIILKASVSESMGTPADRLVTVSASKSELQRSASAVSKALREKPILTKKEIFLAQEVKEIKGRELGYPNSVGKMPSAVRAFQAAPRAADGGFGK